MSSATAVAPPPSQPPPTSLALPKEVLDNVKPAEEFPAFRLKWLSNEVRFFQFLKQISDLQYWRGEFMPAPVIFCTQK